MQMRKLTMVQRQAMKAILGCYRTNHTAAMEIETGLQSSRIRLQTITILATTRIQSLSAIHPIQKRLMNALRTRTAGVGYRSNLENILQQFHTCAIKLRQSRHIFDTHVGYQPQKSVLHQRKMMPKTNMTKLKCT